MITLIEARNFRCLRYVSQPLAPFHVLVGPNASGKTTFLDVVAFLGDLVFGGLEAAVADRSPNFIDLVWGRGLESFELAIEAEIPEKLASLLESKDKGKNGRHRGFNRIRYQVAVGLEPESGVTALLAERVLLKRAAPRKDVPQRDFFPLLQDRPESILQERTATARTIVNKTAGGNDAYYSEVSGESGKGWVPSFRLGPYKSALANLPADESRFPVSTWLKDFLQHGVQRFVLNSLAIRRPSPPGRRRGFWPDGSNLPWVIHELEQQDQPRFAEWIAHLRTALPDLKGVRTIERPEDRHRYLVIEYDEGFSIPSWMASDGTLRLLALTLPAYLDQFGGVYLIEEPENGVHPRAVETMIQSLSSVYGAQMLLASHSPVVLSIVEAQDVLCFAKTPEGATDIIIGSEHPFLRDWRGEANLGMLFAAGVLS